MWLWRGRLRSPLWLCVSHNGSPVLVGFGATRYTFIRPPRTEGYCSYRVSITLTPTDYNHCVAYSASVLFCPPSALSLCSLLCFGWSLSLFGFLSFHAINLPVHLDVRSLELRLLRECFPVCLCFLWCLFDWQGKSSAH